MTGPIFSKRIFLPAAGVGISFCTFIPAAKACPMCSDLLERGRDAAGLLRLTDGVAWSMALLLLMPALVTVSLVIYFRRHWREKADAPARPS